MHEILPLSVSLLAGLSCASAQTYTFATLAVRPSRTRNVRRIRRRLLTAVLSRASGSGGEGLTLFQGSTLLNSNDNWDSNSQVGTVSTAMGAFALASGSLDAALFQSGIATGSYPVQIAGKSAPAGDVLAEIYDATPPSPTATARLVNVSARGQVDVSPGDVVVAGFVVSVRGSTQLLIRGFGPALARFGVAGALEDPVLRIYDRAGVLIATNDDWNSDPLLRASFSAVNAFEPSAASRDAALLLRLPPGSYTAVLSRASGSGGEALIEIYEVP